MDGVPASLRERIVSAVRDSTDVRRAPHEGQRGRTDRSLVSVAPGTLHDQLKAAGDRLLAEARSGSAARDTALTLLAADALMTLACEAMAERDPNGLAGVR